MRTLSASNLFAFFPESIFVKAALAAGCPARDAQGSGSRASPPRMTLAALVDLGFACSKSKG